MTISATKEDAVRVLDEEEKQQKNWKNWRWQVSNSIRTIEQLETVAGFNFTEEEKKELEKTTKKFPMSITPYYLSLVDVENFRSDPVFLQAVPRKSELITSQCDMTDPLSEDTDSPIPFLTHRYPDRVLLLISNLCAMYCRHCTRKRKVGDHDSIPSVAQLQPAIEYIREHTEVRDVLLSGGDPLMLSDERLEQLLRSIREIPHVEIIRIGSRIPVVLPFRVTDDLVNMLKKYQPIYLNTHFNHSREMTADSREALRKLADAGVILGNQTVLLAGVNDCPHVIKELCHQLLTARVRPYYLYQCDLSEGLSHFRTPVGKGVEIMENLIGHTSGLAVPTYVIDAPGGGGKIPVMPNYLLSWSTNKVVLRNYEGVITTYEEPDSYKEVLCLQDCDSCKLQLDKEESTVQGTVGIQSLLSDEDETISLTPAGNERMNRRSE